MKTKNKLFIILFTAAFLLAGAKNTAAQEMYFSISGQDTKILSGDTRHTYDIWIKPADGAQNGLLQIYDAGLGGAVDIIIDETRQNITETTFELFGFEALYEKTPASVKKINTPAVAESVLAAKDEERYINRWVTLSPLSASMENGYVVRVSTSRGGDINSFNLRVISETGETLTPAGWQLIAIDLSVGLYQSSPGKIYQLRPYHASHSGTPVLIIDGEEDSKIKKTDSFGNTYELDETGIPQSIYGQTNHWGVSVTGSVQWLNTLTIYGKEEPVLWTVEPSITDRSEKPGLTLAENSISNCSMRSFELKSTDFTPADFRKAIWLVEGEEAGRGASPDLHFEQTGRSTVRILIPNSGSYYPEFYEYEKEVFIAAAPQARLETAKTIISPSEKLRLSAGNSADPENLPLSYTWFVNGKQSGTGPFFDFSNTVSGQYQISVRVSNGSNTACGTDEAATVIRVNTRPYAELSFNEIAGTREKLAVKAVNISDSDGDSLIFRWSGDNIPEENINSRELTVEHSVPGIYTVRLEVDDQTGASNAVYRTSGRYEINAPSAPAFSLPEKAAPGDALILDAGSSEVPNSATAAFEWYSGNELIASAEKTEFSIDNPGIYTITLKIDDGRNVSNSVQEISRQIRINAAPVAIISAPELTTEAYVEFSARESFDSESSISSYNWDFGDGNRAEGMEVSHTYASPGVYKIRLETDDGDGLANSISAAEKHITINENPTADFTLPEVTAPGQTVRADGSASYDNDGEITSYAWFLNGHNAGSGQTADFEFTEPGLHTVTLQVWDDTGFEEATHLVSKNIRVNAAPVPVWHITPEQPVPGEEILFSAGDSYDLDGTVTDYLWRFDDGSEFQGKTIRRTFEKSGSQHFTLTVTDNDGLENSTASVQSKISVNHRPYIVTQTDIRSNTLNIPLSAAGSYDLDGDPLTFTWTLPDGSKRNEESFNFRASEPGIHFVGLTADDGRGLANSISSETIKILINTPARAIADTEMLACAGQTVLFNSSKSYDPDGDAFSVLWNFGDGTSSEEANPSHIYENAGIYSASLTLDDGFSDFKTVTTIPVIIEDSPIARIRESERTVCVNTPVSFDGSASSDPSGNISSYTWDMGDGTIESGDKITHFFTEPGTYVVTLSIQGTGTDRCGNTSMATTVVHVTQGPKAEFDVPEWVQPGQTVQLDGRKYTDEAEIMSAEWIIQSDQLQDTLTGLANEFTFKEPGEYRVTLSLGAHTTASSCNAAQKTKLIKVNHAPVAVWEIPEKAAAGTSLFLDATRSYDPDGYIKSFKWFLNGDLAGESAGQIIEAVAPGTHTVRLEITDSSPAGNNTVITERTFTANAGPTPKIGMTKERFYPGETVSFYEEETYRGSGTPSYSTTWFVNNEPVPAPSFKAESNGSYRITLVQDDGLGFPNSVDSASVFVQTAGLPEINPDFPAAIVENGVLRLDDYGVPENWMFKTENAYSREWTAKAGSPGPALAWLHDGEELNTIHVDLEVTGQPAFYQPYSEHEIRWNPANPGFILKAPDIDSGRTDFEYTWSAGGKIIGTGPLISVELTKGTNRFHLEAASSGLEGARPITAEIVITAN